jgi:hypothetical protein
MRQLCAGYKSLLGSNDQSVGWDIVNNKSLYNDCAINPYPPNKPADYQVGERIVVILDLDDGTISFCDGTEKLGQCLSGLGLFARMNQQLYPAVSIAKPGAVVEIRNFIGTVGEILYLTERAGVPVLYLYIHISA